MSGGGARLALAEMLQTGSSVVSAVVAVIAGYFGITTYIDSVSKQVDERKVQVMTLHARFTSEPMLSIRKRIYGDIVRAQNCNWDRDKASEPSDQNDRFVFIEFFDVLDACVSSRLCDPALAERLFAPYANGHWYGLKQYVEAVRTSERPMNLSVPFGAGLERLAKSPQRLNC